MNDQAKFVLKKSTVTQKYDEVQKACDTVSYSAKTNYDIAQILEQNTNCMFSVHSIHGLSHIKDTKRAWYFTQGIDKEEITQVLNNNVTHFVVDNEQDLNILLEHVQNIKIHLLLRIRLQEHTIHTGKYYVYGMYMHKAKELIQKLHNHKSIASLGIHFHRKSQNVSEWSLHYELKQMLDEDILNKISYVNIGGGLPVQYKNFRANVLDNIFKEVHTLREWLTQHDIKLIIEPGRYIAAPAMSLHAKIKLIYNNNIVVNCSVYNSAMDTFVTHNKLLIEGEVDRADANSEDIQAYTIKGKTPCSMDILRYRVYLPQVKVGDELIFLNAGAYNYATDFCGLKKIPIEVVE